MANPTSIFDFAAEDLATFLAKAVSDGTQADVFNTLKVDNPGEEALATDIDVASGQLLSNGVDDFIQSSYPFIRAVATETFVDLTVTNDLSVGNNIDMTGASPILTIGDASGSPKVVLNRDAAGTSILEFQDEGVRSWDIENDAADNLLIHNAAGSQIFAALQSGAGFWAGSFSVSSTLTASANVTLDSASPTLTVGDGTASPFLKMDKSVGGNSLMQWAEAGVSKFQLFADGFAQLKFTRSGGAGLMTMRQSDGRIDITNSMMVGANLDLDSASPTMTSGNASGSPIIALKKTGGGTGALRFREGGGAITNWAFIDDATQNMVISRQGGVEVLKFVQASGLAVFANSVTLDSASPTLAVGDGSGSPFLVLDKSETGASEISFHKLGVLSWGIKENANEDFLIQNAGVISLSIDKATDLADFRFGVKVRGDLEMDGALNHDGTTAGFFATTPITKPSITTADAASIIAALAALGLVSDDT